MNAKQPTLQHTAGNFRFNSYSFFPFLHQTQFTTAASINFDSTGLFLKTAITR
jgi:hypothetical protein